MAQHLALAGGQLLELGIDDGTAARASSGWGGDRYELWRARPITGGECCDEASVLVMRWRWDSRRDEGEFAAKLRQWAEAELAGRSFAVVRRGGAVTLAIGPSESLAERVARES